MAANTGQEERATEYAASMTTTEHLDVIAERIETGQRGDFEVGMSMMTVVSNLGRIVSQDTLSFADAVDFVQSRQRLARITEPVVKSNGELPTDPEAVLLLGTLSGIESLVDKITEIKNQQNQR
jgi:hypothetical protein